MYGRSYGTFSPGISTCPFIIIEEANEKIETI
jgi:hypothetical protein